MTTQLHSSWSCSKHRALLQPPERLLRTSSRRAVHAAVAQQAQQQQSRPVLLEDKSTQSFLDWARSQEIQFAKLQPAAFDGVRGLAAKNDMAADEIIVSVPRQAALTLPPKQRCPCPEFVSPAYWDSSPWFVKLGVRLLCEQRKGAASPLHQWIQQLPQQVESPVNWSMESVQQLQYSHLVHKVTEQQHEWIGLYEKFVSEGLVDKSAAAAVPSQQEFFRALSLVRSRTFSGPYVGSTLSDRFRLAGLVAVLVVVNTAIGGDLSNGLGAAAAVFLFNIIYELLLSNKLKQYAMCPVVDLFNHSSINTSEVSYDYPRDAFIVSAATAYTPGQQVFISYGTQTNDSLLQMYGFVEADNPHDAYVMTSLLKWLEQLQAPCQERLDALNREGLLKSLQEVIITRQGFGADTLQALRYLLVPSSSSSSSSGGGQQQQGLPAGAPSSYASAADAATEQKLGLVLVHACLQERAVLGAVPGKHETAAAAAGSSKGRRKQAAAAGGSSSNGGSVPAAATAAIAAAFRLEKQKVLLACLEQLTGETTGSAAAAAAAAAAGSSGGISGSDAGAADAGMQAPAASKR